MRPRDIKEVIKAMLPPSEEREPEPAPVIFLWGPPGVGKSDMLRQISAEIRTEYKDFRLLDWRLIYREPTDIKGLPFPHNDRTRWLVPEELPSGGRGIIFVDELLQATLATQHVANQLVLDRKVDQYEVPGGYYILAASNRITDRANIHPMSTNLRTRFVHIDFAVIKNDKNEDVLCDGYLDDWRAWAIQKGLISEVVEFSSFRPDFLFKFDSKSHVNASPNPRAWEFVSRNIKRLGRLSGEVLHEVICGTVGEGAAIEFREYLKLRKELPSIDAILGGEDVVPKRMDLACAIATGLAVKARSDQFERCVEYFRVLEPEVAMLLAKLLASKDKEALKRCPSWHKWWKDHEEYWDVI